MAEAGDHSAHYEQILHRLQRRNLTEGARGVPVNAAVIEDVLGDGRGLAEQAGQHDSAEPAHPLVAHQDRQPEEHAGLGCLLNEWSDVDCGSRGGGGIPVTDDAEVLGGPGVDRRGNEGRDARTPTERHEPYPESLWPESVSPQEE